MSKRVLQILVLIVTLIMMSSPLISANALKENSPEEIYEYTPNTANKITDDYAVGTDADPINSVNGLWLFAGVFVTGIGCWVVLHDGMDEKSYF